jgi:exonuclease III
MPKKLKEDKTKTGPLGKLEFPLKVLSWNILGKKYISKNYSLSYGHKYDEQIEKLISLNPDIIFLQEADSEFLDLLQKSDLAKTYDICSTSDMEPYGQITLSKRALNYISYRIGGRKSHKQVLFSFNDDYLFVNCHLTSGKEEFKQRISQLKSIQDEIDRKFKNHATMIIGDFNYDGLGELDDILKTKFKEITNNQMKTFLKDNIFNSCIPIKNDHAFDKILANYDFDYKYDVIPSDLSDHCILELLILSVRPEKN